MNDRKVQHVIFGPPGFFRRTDTNNILGLDETETTEILELLRQSAGGNPHHIPRYRELWSKYDRAALLAGFQEPERGDPQ
jgi:hypothetical protein